MNVLQLLTEGQKNQGVSLLQPMVSLRTVPCGDRHKEFAVARR